MVKYVRRGENSPLRGEEIMFKKTVSVLLCILLFVSCFSAAAGAFDVRPKLTYHVGENNENTYVSFAYSDGTCYINDSAYGWTRDGYAFAGWSGEPDGKVVCFGGETVELTENTDLYAVWCPVELEDNEIFFFNNSKRYFTGGEKGKYRMSAEHMAMLEKNIFKTFGPTPVPGIALGAVLATYPEWNWQGSCYGISTVTAMQHYGMLDIKGLQNAETLYDMLNDEELISVINYYQANAATSWLCENKAAKSVSSAYASSMKAMFESVKAGNIVMFTYYTGSAFITPGHTVLFTGAYETAGGEHVLVTYNCNRPSRYTNGIKNDRFILSADYKIMTDDNGAEIGDANWTDTFKQFEAFDIDGDTNTSAWYDTFFAHIKEIFNRLFAMIANIFAVK